MVLATVVLAVGIASVASVETTGRGLADHTISAVRDQDCKLARSIRGEDICQPERKGTVTVSQPTAPQTVQPNSSIQAMEDVFNQRRTRVSK